MSRVRIAVMALVALTAVAGCKKADDKAADDPKPEASAAAEAETPTAQPEPEPEPEPASTVVGEEITYKAGDVELKGYLAYDKSKEGKRPGVLVVHEWWGHNEYTRKRAEMLAELGYTALAVDMYGDGKKADHPDDAQKFMMEVMGNIDAGMKRFDAARELLAAHETTNPESLAAIGYCFGGAVVLHAARTGAALDGVAAFHAGSLDAMAEGKKGEVVSQVLVAHGAADPFVKPESVVAFKKEMETLGVNLEWHEYEGAQHAFTNPGATEKGKKFDLPLAYDEQADKQSWDELKDFLQTIFEA